MLVSPKVTSSCRSCVIIVGSTKKHVLGIVRLKGRNDSLEVLEGLVRSILDMHVFDVRIRQLKTFQLCGVFPECSDESIHLCQQSVLGIFQLGAERFHGERMLVIVIFRQ
jgi:hypothetical protein